jgi:hypothetical protein
MRSCVVGRLEPRAVVLDETAAMKELMRNDIVYSFNMLESITEKAAENVCAIAHPLLRLRREAYLSRFDASSASRQAKTAAS